MAPTTLFQILVDQDAARLRVIAQQWNIPLTAKRPVDQAAELADSLARADAIERILSRLNDAQREGLDGLLRSGGTLPWGVYMRFYGHVRTLGYGKIEREELWKHPESTAEALWFLGLVHRAPGEHEGTVSELAFIPDELLLYIPPPPPLPLPPMPQAPVPSRIKSNADTLVDDLVTWWSSLQIRQITGGEQVANALKRCLHAPAQDRQALLRVLSYEKGWVRSNKENNLRPTEAVLTWLKTSITSQWHTLIEAWISSTWDELAHVSTLAPDPSHGWYHTPDHSRQRLLKALDQCKNNTWYELDAVIGYIKEHMPFILRPDGNFDTWALRQADNGIPLRGYEHWDEIEGAYVRTCLSGPLHWLGLVDLGYTHDETVTHMRLSDMGYAVLHGVPVPELLEPTTIRITEQGRINVPAQRRYERFQLNRVATLSNQRTPYVYRFTPTSLTFARHQHISLKRILYFLEEATENKVPEVLKSTLQSAYDTDISAEITTQWLLRVPKAETLSLEALQPYIVERLGETAAIIRAGDAERLLDLLTEHGILTELRT